MLKTVVRREHKNKWEKRAPLTPSDLKALHEQGLEVDVEHCDIRIFNDDAYRREGIKVVEDISGYQFVVGIKEPPVESILKQQVHLAFSHTIKGQDYNMPLLQKFLDQEATLIDYEPIVNAKGQRTIAFGRYAGIAGAIDTFHIAGLKWAKNSEASALESVKQTIDYPSIEAIKAEFAKIDINKGVPAQVLVVGTGKVGKGAIEVCEWLGLPKIDINLVLKNQQPEGSWYAVASSKHLHESIDGSPFSFRDFVEHGKERYRSTFADILGRFNILVQTPYWEEKYPKHLPSEILLSHKDKLPIVIGDISCDIDGSLACTKKPTKTDKPAFTYIVDSDTVVDEISWEGPTVMAIDNLPCELSQDASEHFSAALMTYMPQLMNMDLNGSFSDLAVADEIKGAIIVYKGELCPNYEYLREYLG